MFAAALIVFRETLEAALFVGIIAAATRQVAERARWLSVGVVLGVMGALAMAVMAERISAWSDGIGQDLVNIGILSIAVVMLLWHCVWVSTHGWQMASDARRLGTSIEAGQRKPWALLIAVALAVLREGAETVLFVAGSIAGTGTSTAAMVLSCSFGVMAGALVGALMYFGLSRIPAARLFAATNVLIALLAASIASQLARALLQAGLVERWSVPLWDSSGLLQPGSAVGTLLHALLGYDAHPAGLQLVFYVATLAIIYVGARLARPTNPVTKPRLVTN